MKITSIRIFSLLIIAIICLSTFVELKSKPNKNKKKNANKKKHAQKKPAKGRLNRLAEEYSSMIKNDNTEKKDESSHYKKCLQDDKYMVTANSKDKLRLIKCLIGEIVYMLGVKENDVKNGMKQFDDKKTMTAFEAVLKFQRSQNFDELKVFGTTYTFVGLNNNSFTPLKRVEIDKFVNYHIRQPMV